MGIEMVPMINIVFLLLVFVILAGGSVRASKEQSELPVLRIDARGVLHLGAEQLPIELPLTRKLPEQLSVQVAADLPAEQLRHILSRLRQAGAINMELQAQP